MALSPPVIKFSIEMTTRKLILASASPRRSELLRLFGIPFSTKPANINEDKCDLETPRQYVIRMAYEKGHSQYAQKDEIILSADTIVDLNGEVLGKPVDDADARRILRLMREKTHQVHTALSLHFGENGEIHRDVCLSHVTMRNYSDEQIDEYISRGTYRDKAGGYAIQDECFNPVAHIEGCYTNVMGLPLCQVYCLLTEAGLSVDAKISELCQRYNHFSFENYLSLLNE